MKLSKLGRTLQEGWVNYRRDGWVTFATVFAMSLILFILGATFVVILSAQLSSKKIQENVDVVSVYFNLDVAENDITDIGKGIKNNTSLREVRYISRKQAFEDFKSAFAKDEILISTINEMEKDGNNPLPASLVLHANPGADYQMIISDMKKEFGDKILDDNYDKNKDTINEIKGMVSRVNKIASVIIAVFSTGAVLIVFNAVRMSMYTRRKEFDVMHLVGASNMYVRMPAVFEGIFYGVSGAVGAIILLVIAVGIFSAVDVSYRSDVAIEFYKTHGVLVIAGIFVAGTVLGMVSSFIAIRRYLEK